nr:hypothetical protein [Tanacetum cinerariifolium]
MAKYDMSTTFSDLTEDSLKTLINTYRIPLDLHPHLPNPGLSMDCLLNDAIGDWFSFAKRRNTEDICMDEVPSSMKLWKNNFFLIGGRAILDYLTWRSPQSYVSEDFPTDGGRAILDYLTWRSPQSYVSEGFPTDGYDQNNVTRLCSCLARLHDRNKAEVVASQPDCKLAKKSKSLVKRKASTSLANDVEDVGLSENDYCAFLEGNLERDKGGSSRAAFALVMRSGKRLRSPPLCSLNPILSNPSHVDTSTDANISSSDCAIILRGTAPVGSAGKARANGSDPPKYTREEWNGPHALKANILTKEIFKDLDVSLFASNSRLREKIKRKSSHLTELRLEFSNLEEKYEKTQQEFPCEAEATTTRPTNELAHTNEKFSDQALVIRDLEKELALESVESQKYRYISTTAEKHFDDLHGEVTCFLGSNIDGLFRKLLSSDKLNSTLAHILSLGITYGIEKGLHMGRTDAEFEDASQNVSNFFFGAQNEFDKAVAALPFAQFPFLAKISKASKSALPKVANIQQDKIIRLAVSASTPSMSSFACKTFG